jgi:hypothetical protein
MNVADAKFDIRTEATRPFYATVGATDLAVEVARNYVTELQGRVADVQKKVVDFEPRSLNDRAVAELNGRRGALTKDAREAQAKLQTRLKELQAELKDAQARLEARVAELQADARSLPAKVQAEVKDLLAEATKAYEDFTRRGEGVVARLRKLEVKVDVEPKETKTTVTAEVKATSGAKKAAAKKAAAKNAPAKKAAAKNAPARKAPAKTVAEKKADSA